MLSSDQKCPANAVMAPQTQDVFWTSYLRSIYVLCLRGEDYYFAETGSKRYRGWPRTTIVSTFQDKIKLTLEKKPSFPVKRLKRSVNLQRVCELCQDRILWRNLITNIYKIAED